MDNENENAPILISSSSSSDSEANMEIGEANTFLLQLKQNKVKSRKVTIPAPFVIDHDLTRFDECTLNFKNYSEVFKLVKYDDRRRTAPPSHVVIKGNWNGFKRSNHFSYGDLLLFCLQLPQTNSGTSVVFNIFKLG